MPRVCGYTTWTIQNVLDKNGVAVSNADITRLFSISTSGLFQTLTTDVLDQYDFWISGVTASTKATPLNIHGLKLTVEPYCYREVISISQTSGVNDEISLYYTTGLQYNKT